MNVEHEGENVKVHTYTHNEWSQKHVHGYHVPQYLLHACPGFSANTESVTVLLTSSSLVSPFVLSDQSHY